MSRPEHLPCINTAEGIHRINEDQRVYDEDPERWERQEQEAREDYEREQHEMQQDYYRQEESRQEQQQDDELPF